MLEPLQANPTIIEDNCFIGARSEVVEGVIVEENSVISMGVYIGQSTKIYDRATGEVTYGRVPAGSVVVSGNLPSPDGKYSLYCAVIVKKVDAADAREDQHQRTAPLLSAPAPRRGAATLTGRRRGVHRPFHLFEGIRNPGRGAYSLALESHKDAPRHVGIADVTGPPVQPDGREVGV